MQFSTYATPAHLSAARNYLAASDFLLSTPKAREPGSPFSVPAHFLVAHGAELTMKAYLSWSGRSNDAVEAFGHNIASAFQAIKEADSALARAVESSVSAKWREYLRAARCSHISALADYGVTSQEGLAELGIPSNADIGEQRPTFAVDLGWLSARHSNNGGTFRYLQFGLDSTGVVQKLGLNEYTAPKTVRWGCEYILNTLESKLRTIQS